ncbi:hypothetical protein ACPXCE_07685 [Streptomyces sp. DT24]|uniref:hypothetical protein n=1 Tax=unclassified Streptomyces TaxID=2593676 RepID=UPI003CF90138
MFLVHACFGTPKSYNAPAELLELVQHALVPSDQVEHVSVHPRPPRYFVLGFYLLSDSLAQAEERTEAICRRLLDDPRLPPATLLSAQAPLVAPLLWP